MNTQCLSDNGKQGIIYSYSEKLISVAGPVSKFLKLVSYAKAFCLPFSLRKGKKELNSVF